MNYPNAANGLKMMFWAEIAAIIASAFSSVEALNFIASLVSVACPIISILGVYTAGRDDEGYKKAFMFTLLALAASVVGACLGLIPFFGTILSNILQVVVTVFNLIVTYCIITTTANILRGIGANDIADRGMDIWKIVMACSLAGAVLGLLAVIPLIDYIAWFLLIIVAVVEIISGILYLMFLYKGYNALGA